MVGRKLEIESGAISALGPVGFHTAQLKEGDLPWKKCSQEIPSLVLSTFEGPLRTAGMGQPGLYFTDISLPLLPILGFQKHLCPEFQGCLVSTTALSDLACVHRGACSMCNISRDTHTSRHTQTHTASGQKTLRSFFQTRIQLVTERSGF